MAAGRHSAKGKAKAARIKELDDERVRRPADRSETSGYSVRSQTSPRRGAAPPRVTEWTADFSALGHRRPPPLRTGVRQPLYRRLWFMITVGVLVIVVALGAVGYSWVNGQVHPGGPPGKQVVVNVPQGETGAGVADLLAKYGVIAHPLVLRLYMRLHPMKAFGAGPYLFREHEAYAGIESTLAAGPDPTLNDTRLTIPEGLTVQQIATRVGRLKGHSSASFLAALASGQVHSSLLASVPSQVPSASKWEGLLFPDTYYVSPNESDVQLAQQMSDRFAQIASKVGLDTGATSLGMTAYQVVVVASILQAEAKTPADMAKVAEVIYNRLQERMKLQLDSTVSYQLALAGQKVTSELTDAQTQQAAGPYNTYLNAGLPPGPISAPGETALNAALHPTVGPWLYYVTIDRQGDLAFAVSYSQQQQNIALAKKNGCPNAC